MGGSVVNYVEARHEVIDWASVNLSGTPSNVLWSAYYCTKPGDARAAIFAELTNRKEF